MLARVAENLYWLGRYLERAENGARLCGVTRLAVSERAGIAESWQTVLNTMGAEEPYAEALETDPSLTPEQFVLNAPESPVSIVSTIARARNLAIELREHTSREVFEEINRLHLSITGGRGVTASNTATQEIIASIATVYGLFENTVLRTEGTHWFRFGQELERAEMTSRIVDAKYFTPLPSVEDVGGALDRYQWRGLLRSASALEAYRKTFRGSIRTDRVVDLLFFNPEFPRSLIFCVNAMQHEFQEATRRAPPVRTLIPATELAVVQLELRAATGAEVIASGLHEFIDTFQATLGRVHDALTVDLFRALPGGALAGAGPAALGPVSSLQST